MGYQDFFHEGMNQMDEWMDGYRMYTLHCWSVDLVSKFSGPHTGAGVACAPKNVVSLVHLKSAMF